MTMSQVLEKIGAGEGNRTLVISLEGFCSTIELHPPVARQDRQDTAFVPRVKSRGESRRRAGWKAADRRPVIAAKSQTDQAKFRWSGKKMNHCGQSN
jgi:hypothetical protein